MWRGRRDTSGAQLPSGGALNTEHRTALRSTHQAHGLLAAALGLAVAGALAGVVAISAVIYLTGGWGALKAYLAIKP